MISIIDKFPSEGERGVGLNSLIEFSILDDGTGLDASSMIVEIDGFIVIESLSFTQGWDGPYSDITINQDSISITIDNENSFITGQTVLIKVKIKNLLGLYSSVDWHFKTITSEPTLVESSPINGELLESDQIFFLKFRDEIDGVNSSSVNVSLNGLKIITDGVFQTLYNGQNSAISVSGNDVSVRIDPEEGIRNGKYTMKYSVEDTIGNRLNGNFDFNVKLKEIILPSVFPQVSFIGIEHGLKGAFNVGNGTSILVEWHKPISRSYKGDTFSLIYYDESRLGIFDGDPKLIADSSVTSATIEGLIPGRTLAFAARGMEAYSGSFDLDGMAILSNGVYLFPSPLILTDYLVDNVNTTFEVASTDGYPNSGVLIVNSMEVVRYTSKTATTFVVPNAFRGLNNTTKGIYLPGDELKIFHSCQDKNTVITTVTPAYSDGYVSGREINGTGVVITDYTDEDRKFFQGFDFCGYHRAIPQNILQGKGDCGSYLGGEFNGFRGMNLFDRMLNREEVLLDQTGEPVILLRRIWDGQTCSCMDSRRMHPKIKSCKNCFGTGFIGGYEQFNYRRRVDGRVMIQFRETAEDLKLGAQSHLEQQNEPQCWTLPAPAIRDRDLIVRFDYTDDMEYIYEVLDVTKGKVLFRNFTRQNLRLKRLDKTDIVYTYPYIFNK